MLGPSAIAVDDKVVPDTMAETSPPPFLRKSLSTNEFNAITNFATLRRQESHRNSTSKVQPEIKPTKRSTMVQNFLRNVVKGTGTPTRTRTIQQSFGRTTLLCEMSWNRTRPRELQSQKSTRLTMNTSMTTLFAHISPRVVPFAPEPNTGDASFILPSEDVQASHRERSKSIKNIVANSVLEPLQLRRSRLLNKIVLAETHKKVLSQYPIRLKTRRRESHQALSFNYVPYLVYPTSTWYKFWRLILVIMTYYQLIAIPYFIAFEPTADPLYDSMGLTTNMCYFIDILIHFNTAVQLSDASFLTIRSHIASRYFGKWFIVDLVSTIPWDVIVYTIVASKDHECTFAGYFKFIRLLRMSRIWAVGGIIRYLRLPDEWKHWMLYSRYAHLLRLLSLLTLFGFLIHLLSCIWYGLVVQPFWVDEMTQRSGTQSLLDAYSLSAYYIVTTVTGQSNSLQTNSEYAFSCIVIILGSLWIAVVFGNVGDLIASYYKDADLFQQKMESLFPSMNLLHLPLDLQTRIVEYYQIMHTRHGTLNGKPYEFVNELSKNLTIEVGLFIRMSMITDNPMFERCSPDFVQELVMQLRFQVHLRDDFIVVRGDVGTEMYFIEHGKCEWTRPYIEASFERRRSTQRGSSENKIRHLGNGDYFGELALLMNVKHIATVKALEFVELCVLSREVFLSVTERHLEDKRAIESFIVEKYDPAVINSLLEIQTTASQDHQRAIVHYIERLGDRISNIQQTMTTWQIQLRLLESIRDRDELKVPVKETTPNLQADHTIHKQDIPLP
ncbi:Voltage-gated Ion Channel (VIC) Superfamily [Thraustotheca clavata]|uniref:Voltage-gated Ion Channel (VIC) Superfamily n=1 Tax=Thraustotheca clavata TaxID=74557 RepID=A0A1V9ZXQ2_9STRA|nr:Voltage-gated Ion Channel (VIC) Superfamily [Thraustotheca clavata]